MGILITDTLTAGTGNTHPLVDDNEIFGGMKTVATLTDRNAIVNARRKEGMIVYVISELKYYTLNAASWLGDNTDWTLFDADYVTLSTEQNIGGYKEFSGQTTFRQGLFVNENAVSTFLGTTYIGSTTLILEQDADGIDSSQMHLKDGSSIKFDANSSANTPELTIAGISDNLSTYTEPDPLNNKNALVTAKAVQNYVSATSIDNIDRANHTGSQSASTINDLSSYISFLETPGYIRGGIALATLAVNTEYIVEGTNNNMELSAPSGTGGRILLVSRSGGIGSTITVNTNRYMNDVLNGTYVFTEAHEIVMCINSDTNKWSVKRIDTETASELSTRDSNNRNRSNHTGTQAASTISDFDTEVTNNSAVTSNTNKISYNSTASDKINTIETNADVTDAANVEAAGALMDSEITNLADVKSFDTTDYATAAQGSKADSASQATGVENNADVTDTINVTNAGALMDSELASIVDVKAINQSLVNGASPVFNASNMTNIPPNTVDVVSNVATSRILGRTTGGSGNSEELTASDVRTLLNIEDGATSNQTASEIKTAYESNSDTNEFSDAEQTKLASLQLQTTFTSGNILVADGDSFESVAMSTDGSVNATGVLTVTGATGNFNVAGKLTHNGLICDPTVSTAGDYTVLLTDYIIHKSGVTSGGDNITLPTGAARGQIFIIKDISGNVDGTDYIMLACESSETIDGAADYRLNTAYGSITVQFNGTSYFVINKM
jgi:hypothetical protein